MKKYEVYGRIHSLKYIGTFEANSEEEAEQMAWDSEEAEIIMCHSCSREVDSDILVVEKSIVTSKSLVWL